MARKLEVDFDDGKEEILYCAGSPLFPILPEPNAVLEEWLRSDPRLTTDQLINFRNQPGGPHD